MAYRKPPSKKVTATNKELKLIDQHSGFVVASSDAHIDYKGLITNKANFDELHPADQVYIHKPMSRPMFPGRPDMITKLGVPGADVVVDYSPVVVPNLNPLPWESIDTPWELWTTPWGQDDY